MYKFSRAHTYYVLLHIFRRKVKYDLIRTQIVSVRYILKSEKYCTNISCVSLNLEMLLTIESSRTFPDQSPNLILASNNNYEE